MLACVTTLDYIVRAATLDDTEEIGRLYVALQRHHVRLQPANPRYRVASTRWAEVARAAIENPKGNVFVVEKNGTTIGMMKLSYADKPWGMSCEIDAMIVDSRHRNKGVGAVMLEAAERHAHEIGAAGLRVDVLLENYDGRRFYERAGYEAIAVRYGKRVPDPD
jgi:GNAT superfamily N-acetyltransferase